MTNAPHNQNSNRSTDALEARLRRDARRAMQPAPAALRSRVMRDIVAAGQPERHHRSPFGRGPILGAAGLALAACMVILVGAILVQPNQPTSVPVGPPAPTQQGERNLFGLFGRFTTSPQQKAEQVVVQTVAVEVDRLRADADRVARPLQAAWAPIKAILATQ